MQRTVQWVRAAEERLARSERWQLAFALLLSLTMTLVLWVAVEPLRPASAGWAEPADHHKYLFMATHPFGELRIAPFCWRPALPAALGMLSADPHIGFAAVSVASVWAAGGLSFAIARRVGLSWRWGLVAVLVYFSSGWIAKAPLMSPYSVDPLAYALGLGAVYLALRRRHRALALLLAGGVMVKECLLFAPALVFGLEARHPLDARAALRALGVGLPAALVHRGAAVGGRAQQGSRLRRRPAIRAPHRAPRPDALRVSRAAPELRHPEAAPHRLERYSRRSAPGCRPPAMRKLPSGGGQARWAGHPSKGGVGVAEVRALI